jgi:chitinase
LGVGCNVKNINDTANFLAFLHQLRNTTAGSNVTLSATAGITPWADSKGIPSKNVSDFSNALDFVTLMSYDIASNSTFGAGSSSPLFDSCAPISARTGSVESGVSAWTAAGFPKNQIVIGVPAYGHSFSVLSGGSGPNTSTTLPMYPFYSEVRVRGDNWDAFPNATNVCGVQEGCGGTYEYWGLIKGGFLNPDGSPQTGIKYRFDNCTKTVGLRLVQGRNQFIECVHSLQPFVYNTTSKLYVSYEDPDSFAYKGEYIRTTGLRGFSMWEAGGDYKDALLDSIRECILLSSTFESTFDAHDLC